MNKKEKEKEELKKIKKEVEKITLHLRAQDRGEIMISFIEAMKNENEKF